MTKRLDRMTSGELGKLFPILISEPDSGWAALFRQERKKISQALGKKNIIRIEHIGSTAVPNLRAKPTIDILLEVPRSIDKNRAKKRLAQLEYHHLPRPDHPAPHMMFAKGYTVHGFKGQAYHVHVRYKGDWDELYFRDYLGVHPDIAQEYGELKARLAKRYRNDREAYTDKKSRFIKRITRIAKREKETGQGPGIR